MAGIAKPNVPNLGAEVTPVIIGFNLREQSNPQGLFDGTQVNEWQSQKVAFWDQDYGGHYVTIDIPKKCNIWRSGTTTWKVNKAPLKINKWNGTSWDDVSASYSLPTTEITNTQWEMFVREIPAGRYKFELTSERGYRIDSEWYMEEPITITSLLKIGADLKTLQGGELVTVTPQTDADWKAHGMTDLSPLFTPNAQGVKPIDLLPNDFEVVTWTDKGSPLTLGLTVEPFKPFDKLPNTFGVESYVEGSTTANLEIGISPTRALDLLESKTPKILMASTDTTPRNVLITSKPPATLILPVKDIDLASIEGIDSVAITLSGTGGTAKVIVSFDSGATWQVYRNGAWSTVQGTTEGAKTSGMTQTEVGAVPSSEWNAKNTKRKIRFGYFLEYDGVSSNLGFDKLSMTVDMKGVFKKAVHGTDYDYGYTNNTTLSVDIKTNGTFKINYPK